ncbi:MAG: class I SAM-dependent methyltransferase [Bacteroidetes bacterium]|nr:class I SAM-dependent methyltransferase [Bacteroidota bacterium]
MQRLNCDINHFTSLIESINFDQLNISKYSKDYIKKNHNSIKYSSQLALQILNIGVCKTNKTVNKLTIAEIGGGTGLISLLASFLGFDKIIYSDIYNQSCEDFKTISKHLNFQVTKVICGSIDEVFIETNGNVDLIVSRDVIEHIYDTNIFFKKSSYSFKKSVHIHNTSANIYNIFKKKYFEKIHLTDELIGGQQIIKPSDSAVSFLKMRYDFIKEHFKEIDDNSIAKLAKITRGKNFDDIKKDAEKFISTKIFPTENTHPTNTCDPANGNRTENLLKFEEYENFIDKNVFKIEWSYAFYDLNEANLLKLSAQKILNFLIKISGKYAKYIAPAIILICTPKSK